MTDKDKRRKWWCDACGKWHLDRTHQNVDDKGRLYCDKWEPITHEMLVAEVEAWFDGALAMQGDA